MARTWKSRFKQGDVVKFDGRWKFMGNTQADGTFRQDVEYTVMDAEMFANQLDDFETPHTLLSPEHPEGSPDGNGRWVDESCLMFAVEEPTDEEIAVLFGVAPDVRNKLLVLARDLVATLEDPTQAWDIALADFEDDVKKLV